MQTNSEIQNLAEPDPLHPKILIAKKTNCHQSTLFSLRLGIAPSLKNNYSNLNLCWSPKYLLKSKILIQTRIPRIRNSLEFWLFWHSDQRISVKLENIGANQILSPKFTISANLKNLTDMRRIPKNPILSVISKSSPNFRKCCWNLNVSTKL